MDDTIFKPLTHMDREGYDENLISRFQRRDTTPIADSVFEHNDTDVINPQEGWEPDSEVERSIENDNDIEANGCMCPSDPDEANIVYSETVIVEFFDDDQK